MENISNSHFITPSLVSAKADVYTDLQGLESIKHLDDKELALRQVAKQFEALFVQMMTKSMRDANAVFEEGNPFSSNETRFYRDMLDQQRSLTLSERGGIGIADALYRQLSGRVASPEKENGKGRSNSSAMINDFNSRRVITRKETLTHPTTSSGSDTFAQTPPSPPADRVNLADSPSDFVDKVLPFAKRAASALGLDPLVLVAQSALETGWGKHVLAKESGESSHNVFNIKASGGHEDSTRKRTLEFIDGAMRVEQADFRVYDSLAESFADYVRFVKGNPRYQDAIAKSDDAEQYVDALHKAGYATDPEYSNKVKQVYSQLKAGYGREDGGV